MPGEEIPDLVPHCRNWLCRWWRSKCPDCEQTFTNDMWQMSVIGYPLHYAMVHLGITPFRRLTDGR